jgi:hypothetical protein
MPAIEKVGEGVFRVESESSTASYIVDLNGSQPNGLGTCTCTSFAMKRNRSVTNGQYAECKHMTWVKNSKPGSIHQAPKIQPKAATKKPVVKQPDPTKEEIRRRFELVKTREKLTRELQDLEET